MKTIGLIGGLTYVSSLEYYRFLNEMMNEKLGGSNAARMILYSVNFGDIRKYTEAKDWASISKIICDAAQRLEKAGADCIMIGANTMHMIADDVQASVNIPVIHLVKALAAAIKKQKASTVALLGTKYTMQMQFYKDILEAEGIKVLIPGEEDIEFINHTIYTEFSKNSFLPETKKRYIEIIKDLQQQGAEGVILGCTEIPILLSQADSSIHLYDTAKIHSAAAVEWALS